MTASEMHVLVSKVLLAGDIQSRPVRNTKGGWVEVRYENQGIALWGLNEGKWSYLVLDKDGNQVDAGISLLDGDATPEEVAQHIACFEHF